MKEFLQRFALIVAGVLQGFDRLVFKGKLPQLYRPGGMNTFLSVNEVLREDFKSYAGQATAKVLKASLVGQAKACQRFRYLNSSSIDKEAVAREFAVQHQVQEGLVCVLQCVEPCWTFDNAKTPDGTPTIQGERGRCSHLYHYYIHPQFGWMYVRLQTWFPFEIQVGINGREWLARQMDRENLKYERSGNKFLWVENWQRAQQLLDEQLQTDWVQELDALKQQVHPLYRRILGRMPVAYNWTVFQSEWATDVAFVSQEVLKPWFDRWLRQAFFSYDSAQVLRFLGRSDRIRKDGTLTVKTNVRDFFEGQRIKHWVNSNSLKLYNEFNILRGEHTVNHPEEILVLRPSQNDPHWRPHWRPMRRTVLDLPQRAEVGRQTTERYLEALATTAETRTLQELTEPLTQRVLEPNPKAARPARRVRALNPLAQKDATLLTAISDPKWMEQGLRNRDLVAVLYDTPAPDPQERRRRSAQVTRLLRILRGHDLLYKIPGTHRYQLSPEARTKVQALLAARNANPAELMSKVA